MKKFLSLLLVLLLAVTMVGCGKEEAAAPATEGGEEAPTTETVEEDENNRIAVILQEGGLGDQGYNDGAKIGADMMEAKYGTKATLVEAAAVAEADTFIRELANEGYPLIICLDWTIIQQVKDASVDYPDTLFVVLGKSLPGPGTQENLIEPYTALHERGFLMGMLSILFAKDGNEIRHDYAKPGCNVAIMTAGESINHGRNIAGYQQAIAEFDPENGVLINDTTGGKTDAALNATIAENLIKNQGVEVIWPNIGTGSLSVYTTCANNNTYALGIDVDQDSLEPGTMISSGRHDTTYMVVDMVERWKAGNLKGTDDIYWGIQTGVVGITDMTTIEQYVDEDLKDNWTRVKGIVDDYCKKIESGEFVCYNFFVEDKVLFDDWQAAHPGVDYSEWVNAGRK